MKGFDYSYFFSFNGEKAGASTNMEQLQSLLVESKAEVSQLTGKLRATENQVDSLQKSKDEVRSR